MQNIEEQNKICKLPMQYKKTVLLEHVGHWPVCKFNWSLWALVIIILGIFCSTATFFFLIKEKHFAFQQNELLCCFVLLVRTSPKHSKYD